jgi:hypothetical protein
MLSLIDWCVELAAVPDERHRGLVERDRVAFLRDPVVEDDRRELAVVGDLLEVELAEHAAFDRGVALRRVSQHEIIRRLALRRRLQLADGVPPTRVEDDRRAGLRLERFDEMLLENLVQTGVDEHRDRPPAEVPALLRRGFAAPAREGREADRTGPRASEECPPRGARCRPRIIMTLHKVSGYGSASGGASVTPAATEQKTASATSITAVEQSPGLRRSARSGLRPGTSVRHRRGRTRGTSGCARRRT